MPPASQPPTRQNIAHIKAEARAASGEGQSKAFLLGVELGVALGVALAFLLTWGYLNWSAYMRRQELSNLEELGLSQETVQAIQNGASNTSDPEAAVILGIMAYFAFRAWNKFRQPHWNTFAKEKWLGFACAFGFFMLPLALIWIT